MDKGTAAVPPHVALISGSLAGLGVDITLFPLGTQSFTSLKADLRQDIN